MVKPASATICLVTSGTPASSPRLVKEAEALINAGYFVRIVATDIIASLRSFDRDIMAKIGCDFTLVPTQRRIQRGITRRLAQRVLRLSPGNGKLALAARAHHPLSVALARAAADNHADLFIGHNLAGLFAAAFAARRHQSRLGFDAEDFHSGELEEDDANRVEIGARRTIEGALLPRCVHRTGASPGISEAYRTRYGVEMKTILNVFPLHDAPPAPVVPSEPSLYWFSQTIGPGRGLEQIVHAMAEMQSKPRLRLRGHSAPGYVEQLRRSASEAGGRELAERIDILPVAPPAEMARLAAEHSLGLSVEPGANLNNNLALGNKIFTYLLAGVPVVMSATAAHTALLPRIESAARLVDLEDAAATARVLDDWLADVETQTNARQAAWDISRTTFNWEAEQEQFLSSVGRALDDYAAEN